MDALGFWPLKRLGYERASYALPAEFRLRLPPDAHQGPTRWYVVRFHLSLRLAADSRFGRIIAFVGMRPGVCGGFFATVRRAGAKWVVRWTEGSVANGGRSAVRLAGASPPLLDIRLRSYCSIPAIVPGAGILRVAVSAYGGVRVAAARVLADSGLEVTRTSYEEAGRAEPRYGRTGGLDAVVTRAGVRPGESIRVGFRALDYSGRPFRAVVSAETSPRLAVEGAATQRVLVPGLDFASGAFAIRALRSGPAHVLLRHGGARVLVTVPVSRGPPRQSPREPSLAPARAIQRWLDRAWSANSVRFDLELAFRVRVDEKLLRREASSLREFGGIAKVRRLARHPFRLRLKGARSADGITATGTVVSAAAERPIAIVGTPAATFIRVDGLWYRWGSLKQIFSISVFGALVPAEACVREDEGCGRVDFRLPLRSGRLARLIRGVLRPGPVLDGVETSEVVGAPNADEFARLYDAQEPGTFDPLGEFGSLRLAAGRADAFPRRLVLSYAFDRDALAQSRGFESVGEHAVVAREARIELRLSGWGEPVTVEPPADALDFQTIASRALPAFFRGLYLFYW